MGNRKSKSLPQLINQMPHLWQDQLRHPQLHRPRRPRHGEDQLPPPLPPPPGSSSPRSKSPHNSASRNNSPKPIERPLDHPPHHITRQVSPAHPRPTRGRQKSHPHPPAPAATAAAARPTGSRVILHNTIMTDRMPRRLQQIANPLPAAIRRFRPRIAERNDSTTRTNFRRRFGMLIVDMAISTAARSPARSTARGFADDLPNLFVDHIRIRPRLQRQIQPARGCRDRQHLRHAGVPR